MRALLCLACLLALAARLPADDAKKPVAVPTALAEYVAKADDSFAWKLVEKVEANGAAVLTYALTSQTWQGIRWEHDLQIYVPKNAKPQATMVLWNQGGRASPTGAVLGLAIADKVGAPVAFLFGVPKQPLFGGKGEDALIAETFVRYLDTKDASWPLLFPMVKSVVRAMDALQGIAKEEWKADVTGFVVTGASKRGWTSWLTAATGDRRVKAIAPLVIDTLNFPVQMRNQVAAFGKPSDMIKDYTERKLVPIPDTAEGKALWQMVDPWVYREKLTVPKMVINGTNDPYWPQDALNTYWADLPGEKHLCYVPNAGHDLREADKAGVKQMLPLRAVNTLSAFCRCQIFDKPMPKLSWEWDADRAKHRVTAAGTVRAVRAWQADATGKDFRKSVWTVAQSSGPTEKGVGPAAYEFDVARPESGFRATLVEVEFDIAGAPATLTTQVRILAAAKK